MEINYQNVLADLHAKKVAIDDAIRGISALMNLGTLSSALPSQDAVEDTRLAHSEIEPDAFFGLSIVEATKKFLSMSKRPKTTGEVLAALEGGGYNHTSKNFRSTIFSVLARESKSISGEIVKVNDRWGLAEWYPNRRRDAPAKSLRTRISDEPSQETPELARLEAGEGSVDDLLEL